MPKGKKVDPSIHPVKNEVLTLNTANKRKNKAINLKPFEILAECIDPLESKDLHESANPIELEQHPHFPMRYQNSSGTGHQDEEAKIIQEAIRQKIRLAKKIRKSQTATRNFDETFKRRSLELQNLSRQFGVKRIHERITRFKEEISTIGSLSARQFYSENGCRETVHQIFILYSSLEISIKRQKKLLEYLDQNPKFTEAQYKEYYDKILLLQNFLLELKDLKEKANHSFSNQHYKLLDNSATDLIQAVRAQATLERMQRDQCPANIQAQQHTSPLQATQERQYVPVEKPIIVTVEVVRQKVHYEVDKVIKNIGFDTTIALKVTCEDCQGNKRTELRPLTVYQKNHLYNNIDKAQLKDRELIIEPSRKHGETPIRFKVRSDGRIELQSFQDNNIILNIKSHKDDIVLAGDIVCQEMNIQAARIINHAQMLANHVRFIANEYENLGHLLSRISCGIEIRKGHLRNHRQATMVSRGVMVIDTQKPLENAGLIAAESLKATLEGGLKNRREGRLFCEKNMRLYAAKDIENFGELSAKNICLIGKQNLNNGAQGIILATHALDATFSNSCLNEGLIKSGEEATIYSVVLENGRTGRIVSQCILKTYNDEIENSGKMFAGSYIDLNASQSIECQTKSVIASGYKAKLFAAEQIRNQGVLAAKEWFVLVGIESIYNEIGGQIQGPGFVRIDSLEEFNNFSEVLAGLQVSIEAPIFQNAGKKALVSSRQDVQVQSGDLINAGVIVAFEKVLLMIARKIQHLPKAETCGEDVQILAKILENNGNIFSNHHLSVQILEVLHNYTFGKMESKKTLEIIANKLMNAGLIKASENMKLDITQIFDQAKSGVISSEMMITLICGTVIHNSGKFEALKNIKIKAQKLIQAMEQGQLVSKEELEIIVDAIDNNGLIVGKEIYVAKKDRNQSGDQKGIMEEKKEMDIPEGVEIKNDVKGKMISDNNSVFYTGTLKNLGLIEVAQGKLSLRSRILFENLVEGRINVGDAIDILAGKVINRGHIKAATQILMNTLSIFEQTAEGLLSAGASIALLCKDLIENVGKIEAHENIKIEATKVLKNLKGGKLISKKSVELMLSASLQNAGLISGKDVSIVTSSEQMAFIENLVAADIVAENDLNLKSVTLQNEGNIKTDQGKLTLSEFLLFKNLEQGNITAAGVLTITGKKGENLGKILAESGGNLHFSEDFIHRGGLKADKDLSISGAQALLLYSSGKIECRKALTLLSNQKVYSEGDVFAYETLCIAAATLEQKGGQLESKTGDVILKEITDWILAGHIKAAHDLVANIKNQWTWDAKGIFEASHLAKLILKKGYDFQREILHQGSLELSCDPSSTFIFRRKVSAAGDLIVGGGKVINCQEGPQGMLCATGSFTSNGVSFENLTGGVFGGTGLSIHHHNGIQLGRAVEGQKQFSQQIDSHPHFNRMKFFRKMKARDDNNFSHFGSKPFTYSLPWKYSNGAYFATGGDAEFSTQGHFISDLGHIEVDKDCRFTVAGDIHNKAGIIRGGRNVSFHCHQLFNSLIEHHHAVQGSGLKNHIAHRVCSDKANILGMNVDLSKVHQLKVLGSNILAGHTLTKAQNQDIKTSEEYETWQETQWVEGEKEARKLSNGFGAFGRDREWVQKTTNQRNDIAQHVPQVVGGQSITGGNPNGHYRLDGYMQTQSLALQFQHLEINGAARPQNIGFEISLDQYLNPHSRLFQAGADPNARAYISPAVPFQRFSKTMPKRIVIGNVDESVIDPYIDEIVEARFLQQDMAEKLGFVEMGDNTGSLEDIYYSFLKNAEEYAKNLGVTTLTEESLARAPKPMLVYRSVTVGAKIYLRASRIFPAQSKPSHGMYAKNALLQGDEKSRMEVNGVFSVSEMTELSAGALLVTQQVLKEEVVAHVKGRATTIMTTRPAEGTGIISSGGARIKVSVYQQTGGEVRTGEGGLALEVERKATFEHLRTTGVEQGKQDATIRPEFTPARMLSEGNQSVKVKQGPCVLKGVESIAGKDNSISARDGVYLETGVEEYAEPTTKKGHGLNKKTIHSTTSAVSETLFMAGGTATLESETVVQLKGVTTASGKDTNIKGQNVVVEEVEFKESKDVREKRLQGTKVTKTRTKIKEQTPLVTQSWVKGNLNIEARERAKLKGYQAKVGKNVNIHAKETVLSGVKKTVSMERTTHSLSVDFFGSDALQTVSNKESCKKAGLQLLRRHAFLAAAEQLIQSRDLSSVSIHSIHTFVEGFKLISSLAKAYKSADPVTGSMAGTLTDQLGLTKVNAEGQREFNPALTFALDTLQERSYQEQTMPAVLRAGGVVTIEGDDIRLLDGTKISANAIKLAAKSILELRAAEDRSEYSSQRNTQSVTVTARDATIASAGVSFSESGSSQVQHQNVQLQAVTTAELSAGTRMVANGADVAATNISLTAPEIIYNSVQDTHESQVDSQSLSVTPTTVSGGLAVQHEKGKKTVSSSMHATQNLSVKTNILNQGGSALISDQNASLSRFDGGSGPVEHHVQHLQDSYSNTSTAINATISLVPTALPVTGSFLRKKESKEGETFATFSAPNLQGAISADANTDATRLSETYSHQKSNVGLGFLAFNSTEMISDLQSIQQAFFQMSTSNVPTDVGGSTRIPATIPVPNGTEHRGIREGQRPIERKIEERQAEERKTDERLDGLRKTDRNKDSGQNDHNGQKPLIPGMDKRGKKIRVATDKRGRTYHSDAASGRRSQSPLSEARKDKPAMIKRDKAKVKVQHAGTEICRSFDLYRKNVGSNPHLITSMGATGVAAVKATIDSTLKPGEISLAGAASATAGINLINSELSSSHLNGIVQVSGKGEVNVLTGNAHVAGELNLGRNGKYGVEAAVGAVVSAANANLELNPKIETEQYKMECKLKVETHALGLGGTAAIGAESYKTKPGGSLHMQLGLVPVVGVVTKLHCNVEPKEPSKDPVLLPIPTQR